ncbi:hypothetical protein, partial [uncultured Microscilla sp.]|uniref:hypothetical protein n=1 Tax=uncultured Microscilla sp. TaxID=432653 RepID=UPI00262227F3
EEVKELSKLLKWNRVYKPDVYQSVSKLKKHSPAKDWKINTNLNVADPKYGKYEIETYIYFKNKQVGRFIRQYDANTNHFKMDIAELELKKVPKTTSIIPVTNGKLISKGIPIVTYVNLHQMKVLGIKPGSLKIGSMGSITNTPSNLQLAWLIKKYPQKKVEDLFKLTPSYRYAETVYLQSGHQIDDVIIVNLPVQHKGKLSVDDIHEIASNKDFFDKKGMKIELQYSTNELVKYPGLSINDFLPTNYNVYFILK